HGPRPSAVPSPWHSGATLTGQRLTAKNAPAVPCGTLWHSGRLLELRGHLEGDHKASSSASLNAAALLKGISGSSVSAWSITSASFGGSLGLRFRMETGRVSRT